MKWMIAIGSVAVLVSVFQNCSGARFTVVSDDSASTAVPCGLISCTLTPLTFKPAVTTILLALGDEAENKLVGNNVSNQFLAESVIRFSSPQKEPKILIVRALNHHGEDPEDTAYVQNLLSRYQTNLIDEPASGLSPGDVQGYDLIWFNNPGYPFSSKESYDTLMAFEGAVVLQGDDLSRADGFSLTPLTGLNHIDNGTVVRCGDKEYRHDNNGGEQYRVTLNPEKIQGVDQATVSFRYGNDIDNTTVASPDVEVLAFAVGGPSECVDMRPAVVRRLKNPSSD